MTGPGQKPAQALIAKLERRDSLSSDERLALTALLDSPRLYLAGSEILHPGIWPETSTLLISGLAARLSGLEAGGRSITQLSIAGDFLDLHSLVMKQIDYGVVAISDCVTAALPHNRLVDLLDDYPHLGRLLWLETAIDGAIQREWFHRLGRQGALPRMAHLFCELQARLEIVGLADETGFSLTLTQNDLANCIGLSAVHVNRVLKELRDRQLVEWRAGRVSLLDKPALEKIAEFNPTYLRLHSAPV
ncbi:Crp/Fnr family transcriptional regulator [Brevundimonas nasdae]|uniref:Crp/Fnr family transcriptional regulator n=1 Tax=Brevundimonas nasdae TaxID=172043 RepID=A0ABX8TI54_9CAUL|nr:Crp/Fnr family transcriptional regulator [Brevundimonas nasdae]QYC10684.1 Crp/Fnr family transcriptional regulator [Brevundimonas nasdae]QYC13471.1 Crp/Fnr family transcriptional regulator [Brevundimonas nasdae]